MGRGLELIAGLLLAVVSLVFAAGALELGVRILHLEPDRFWEADPLLGTRHIAGKSGWWTQEEREFVVPVTINAEGWRDIERSPEKPHGVLRVLVLGDSFTEALQVPLEDAFTRRLETALEQLRAGPVEVINTGISGFGTAGQLLLLRRVGAPYRPDVVLLAFFPGNDVMNNSPDLEKTLVPVYADGKRLERVISTKLPRQTRGMVRRLLAHSKAYRYFRRRIMLGHPALARLLGLSKPAQNGVGEEVPTGYLVYAPPEPAWEKAWAHTERLIDDMRTETEQLGAKLAVAVVSSREEVYPEWWEEAKQAHPAMQGRTWDVDAPRRRIVEICRARGIPVLELAPILRARKDGEPLHFHRDGHWTAAGHRLAAEEMANFLVNAGLVPEDTEGRHEVH